MKMISGPMNVLTYSSYCDKSHVKGAICKNRPPVKFLLKTNRGEHIRVPVNETAIKQKMCTCRPFKTNNLIQSRAFTN